MRCCTLMRHNGVEHSAADGLGAVHVSCLRREVALTCGCDVTTCNLSNNRLLTLHLTIRNSPNNQSLKRDL